MSQPTIADVKADIRKEFPDFKLVPKEQSGLMKAANIALKIITFGQMKSFMTTFTTTMGYTVYTPRNWEKRSAASRAVTLRHERIHMRQRKKYGWFGFGFLYLFVFFPIALAYFRMKFEKEAYEESLRAVKEYYGMRPLKKADTRERYIDHFTTAQYFWMWPFRGAIGRWYDDVVEELGKS